MYINWSSMPTDNISAEFFWAHTAAVLNDTNLTAVFHVVKVRLGTYNTRFQVEITIINISD